jgi:hypothetical protein
MDIIKNPVVIGVLAGLITYVYMIWTTNQNKKKKKQHKKLGNGANLPIVLAVASIAWFIAYSYFENELKQSGGLIPLPSSSFPKKPSYSLSQNLSSSSENTRSFSLLKNGINVPNTLPELSNTLLEMK